MGFRGRVRSREGGVSRSGDGGGDGDGGSAGAAHRDDPGDGVSRSDGTCAGSAHREDFHVASRLGVAGVVVVAVFVVDGVDSCGCWCWCCG